MTFGLRLSEAMQEWGPLCVGIDPHPALLAEWGLPDTPESLAAFGQTVLEASFRSCAAVKPNAAFFERHGARGVAALELILRQARDQGILTILDSKRGDIGSTMLAYAQSCLERGAPLEADSVTLSPYLGFGSLAPALELAEANGKGVFVLALTSNPEGASVQHAVGEDGPVAVAMAEAAAELNRGAQPMGSVGLVVGATIGDAARELGMDLAAVNGPLLAPGVGAQGATAQDVAKAFGAAAPLVLVNQSRGVLQAGPLLEKLRGAIRGAAADAHYALHAAEGTT